MYAQYNARSSASVSTYYPKMALHAPPALPGFTGGMSAITGHLQGDRSTGSVNSNTVTGAVGYGSTQGVSPLEALFGTPLGHAFDMYRRENMGVGTQEEHRSQRVLDYSTQVSTAAFLQASNPILNRLAQFTITYDHNIRMKQTHYNMIPAQPQAHMTIPKFNTRGVLEWMISGHRSGAAAEARMEELLDPEYGPGVRDFMITSVTASCIFEQAQLVLATAVSEARLSVFVQTGGQRGHRFASLDRQLLEEVLYFGALNKGKTEGVNMLNHALNQFNNSGETLIFLPYSAATFARSHIPVNKAVGTLAALSVAPSAARVLGMEIMNRSGAWSVNPESEEAFALGGNQSARVYITPQNSMDSYDDETLGALDSFVTMANWWRNPVLGNNGQRNPRARFGDEAIYDDDSDTKQPVFAHAALQHLGIWRDGSGIGMAGVYPDDMSDAALFTDKLRAYVASKRNDGPPTNHNEYTVIGKTARKPLGYITSSSERCDDIMPFTSYWEGADGSREWFIPHHIGEMHPEALPHAATTTAARELMNFVADHPHLRDLGIHPQDAFAELFRCIDTIIKNTVYNENWIKRIVASNPDTEINPVDGTVQVKRTSRGGLVLPTNEANPRLGGGVGADIAIAAAYPPNAFGWGCWTIPMMRELAVFDITRHATVMTNTMLQVCQKLQTLLPQLDRIVKVIQAILPETPLFAANCASPWLRTSDDSLAAMVGNMMGDTPLFVNMTLNTRTRGRNQQFTTQLTTTALLNQRPLVTAESILDVMYIGGEWVTSEKFKRPTDAVSTKYHQYFNIGETRDWKSVITAVSRLNHNHGGKTMVIGFIRKLLQQDVVLGAVATDAAFADALGLLSPEYQQLLGVDPANITASALYTEASLTNDKHLWVVAAYLAEKLFALVNANPTKDSLSENAEFIAIVRALNSNNGDAAAALRIPRDTVVGAVPDTATAWARTPLGIRYDDIDLFSPAKLEAMPGDIQLQHTRQVTDTDAMLAVKSLYVNPDETRAGITETARVDARNFGDAHNLYAPREAYAGVRPVATGRVTGAHITANVFQMHKGSSARASLLQFRNQMFRLNSLGGGGKLFEVLWLAYIMTPLTLYSMETLFREQRVIPPFDIGYARWSQLYQTADALFAAPGAVKVFMAPLEGYLTLGNMHRMVLYNLQKRSMEFVDNPKSVYVAHSIMVNRLLGGRNTGFMHPGLVFDPDFFYRRDNMHNIMPIVEKITHRWDGILHLDNNADLNMFRDVRVFGSIGSTHWSAQPFYINYLYPQWYHRIGITRSIRGNQFTPATYTQKRNWAGLAGKHVPLAAATYAFRGESYRPNEVDGKWDVRVPGYQYSPLGHEFWNMPDHRKALDGQYSFEDVINVRSTSFA